MTEKARHDQRQNEAEQNNWSYSPEAGHDSGNCCAEEISCDQATDL